MGLSDTGATLTVRLNSVEYGALGINHYHFGSADGTALPGFEPGAHIDLELGDGVTRQYSLLWPPRSPSEYSLAVQVSEAGQGGSRRLHYQSVVGASYRISAPRNHFLLQPDPAPCYLLAGGIGITPIMSMYRQLRASGRPVRLFYWAATPEHMLFRNELLADPEHVCLTATRMGGEVARLADVLATVPAQAQLYACGPQAMIEAFDTLCADRDPGRVHRERFSPALDALQPGESFRVRLQRSGLELVVGPQQTLLQACEAAGVEVSYSCEEGLCGACEVKVLAGQVEHRDSVLSPKERQANSHMMLCCSRGLGDGLVLDL